MILVETMLASSLFVGCAAIAVAVGAAGAKLVDTFGSKLGLYRPMPDSDPAQVQIEVIALHRPLCWRRSFGEQRAFPIRAAAAKPRSM